ncbi:MAG: hypothetical protein KF799_15530 [Bdellovibrionales bacterium]|nr:hypothetical protein [Bdellovibrionales bacterium]
MASLNLILASLRRQKTLYGIWVLSLCLAVTGLVIIDVYRQSLAGMIREQGRKILTGDLSMSARRQLNETERRTFTAAVPQPAQMAESYDMMAMISTDKESRLAMVRFITDAYPLVGQIQLSERAGDVQGADLLSGDAIKMWIAADLVPLMNLKMGDQVKLGAITAEVAGIIQKDSSQTLRFGGLAPRVYLHRTQLEPARLIQFGSTFTNSLYALTPDVDNEALRRSLDTQLTDPGLEITSPRDMERGALRVLTRVLDYLGLIGLVTLSLGWIGVYYLGRRWLTLERTPSALLKCIGLSSLELQNLLLLKLSVILCAGVILGGALSWVGAHAVLPMFKSSLPPEFVLLWSWKSTALLLVIGPLAGLLLLYAPLRAVAFEAPLSLLNANPARVELSWQRLTALAGSVVFLFVALTFLQARSWNVTGVFLAALVGCVIAIAGVAYLFLRAVRSARRQRQGWRWHLASAQWLGRPGTALLLVIVSALAGLLAQMVPHLERTIVGEIRPPEQGSRPALFLFDVQEEQTEPLTAMLRADGAEISQSSPFIRSRLLQVNGAPFERAQTGEWSTREEENEARFRNRGVNLTYRAHLSPSEKIVAGVDYESMPEDQVSVEKDYAERLGFKVGDRLLFDVQGVEIEAAIGSLREVNWDSFEPNFFIQFKSGMLGEAPKTWIMTVKRHASLSAPQMQRLITGKFPNVSSINVQEALDNLTDIVTKLSGGLKVASRLAMALGVFVFLMILLFQLLSSRQDWVQLRVQGLTPGQIWQLQLLIYGGLALLGTLLGTLLAGAANWGLAHFAFRTHPQFDVPAMLVILSITWVLAWIGLTWMSLRQARDIARSLRSLNSV